ncbi:MAG TPA: hypothetical protein VMV98_06705, partial [Acidobacteriaceae bacterium]|nr:hypothetical protein [Acidobacteriaceae bacterium]
MRTSKKEIITSLVDQARSFRFCGPSDDPDEQTAVTFGFRHLVIQFKRLVGPILPEAAASRLDAIDVEGNNICSAYEAKAELDALLPDIEDVLEQLDDSGIPITTNLWVIDRALVTRLADIKSSQVEIAPLEHFSYFRIVPRRSLNHASALSAVIWGSRSVMAWSRAWAVEALAA